jgi:hypothetical protein
MKTVVFHSNQLGIRGTEVALYDYALYNETILGNKSYIISDAKKDLTTLKKFQKRFEVFLYNDFRECEDFIKKTNTSHVYYIKAGDNDGKILPSVKNLVHVVFQNKQPHGDVYAYVSCWLAKKMGMEESYVPHIVSLPEPNQNLREKLNIPQDKIVVGRHGGLHDFDLPFVKEAIVKILTKRDDLAFVFMNTHPFGIDNPNLIFLEGTYNIQNKSNYIDMCDYMIHARQHGESFGLATGEFLHNDKPVISWRGGLDQNHIEVLGDKGIWYEDFNSVYKIFQNLQKPNFERGTFQTIAQQFSPEAVMERFDKIFLK